MFKRIDGLFLCFLFCLGISLTCAGQPAAASGVQYEWTPGKSYYFLQSINSGDQESLGMPLIIECISQNSKGHFTLCVRIPERSSDLVFPTVDEYGAIQDIRICHNDPMPPKDGKDGRIFEHVNRIPSVIGAYDERSWLLPRASSDPGAMLSMPGCVFTMQQTSLTKQGVIQISVRPLRSERLQTGSQVRTISFNLNRGFPTTIVEKGPADFEKRIDYTKTKQIDGNVIQERHRSLRAAVTVDEYLISNAAEFIAHDNRRIRKTSYIMLQRVESCGQREKVWQHMRPAFSSDPSFKMLLELFLMQSAKSGCDWAIAESLSNWDELSDSLRMRRISVLESFAGVRLGDKPIAWRDWFRRVKLALPAVQNSTKDALRQHLDSEDVWVKIYALIELSEKDDIPIDEWRRILKNAIVDQDARVKEVAMDLLRKLQ